MIILTTSLNLRAVPEKTANSHNNVTPTIWKRTHKHQSLEISSKTDSKSLSFVQIMLNSFK